MLQDFGEEPEIPSSSSAASTMLLVKAACGAKSVDSGSSSESSSSGAGSFVVVDPVPAVREASDAGDDEDLVNTLDAAASVSL